MIGKRGTIWWCPNGCGKTINRTGTFECTYECIKCHNKWVGRKELEIAQNAGN